MKQVAMVCAALCLGWTTMSARASRAAWAAGTTAARRPVVVVLRAGEQRRGAQRGEREGDDVFHFHILPFVLLVGVNFVVAQSASVSNPLKAVCCRLCLASLFMPPI